MLTNPEFARYPLWIADYGKGISQLPSPWNHKGWLIWQYSQQGEIDGISGDVDLDRFHSDTSTLKKFVDESHTPAPFADLLILKDLKSYE
ncbi:hypothetical protein A9Q81_12950 [Gammaproteobacteria bacterium 42_54_T18]|nr:hypothetical protein A9Q81_12950 [Gammaproteobacteria bacterium 42_54_T18]